ncbi:MAG: serpin family protein [Armatimonadota bacterium]
MAANTRFGFALFSALREEQPTSNVFISPASIAMALAMTYNGAAGETKAAMAKALSLGDMTLDTLNHANDDLRSSLAQADEDVELTVANSLWIRQGAPFAEDFLGVNEDFYGAELAELDFDSPEAADTINDWVRKESRERIDGIMEPPIDPLAVLFLINAVYFNGKWKHAFEKGDTKPADFTLLDGSTKSVHMMSQTEEFGYLDGEGFQTVSLPYGTGRLSMFILLPDRDSSLAELCEGLEAESWEAIAGELRSREVILKLPRFTAEYEAKLNAALIALGMGVAFESERGDFSKMVAEGPPLYISKVKHKAYVRVDEEGTEAAAATSVEMRLGAAAPTEPVKVIVDRPFFCAIRDKQTGTVLFMGAIVDPE